MSSVSAVASKVHFSPRSHKALMKRPAKRMRKVGTMSVTVTISMAVKLGL